MPPPSPEWAGHLAYFHPRILAVEELLVDRAWSSTAPAGPGRWRHGIGEPRMPAMETSPLLGSCRVG
jgi:hypothetical protein